MHPDDEMLCVTKIGKQLAKAPLASLWLTHHSLTTSASPVANAPLADPPPKATIPLAEAKKARWQSLVFPQKLNDFKMLSVWHSRDRRFNSVQLHQRPQGVIHEIG
ncbi:hypothetical protein [Fundidesulfovibrio butyratiphilus]